MRLAAKAMQQHEPLIQVSLTNAVARLTRGYQEGMLTLQKLRTGGKQTVVVQHVQVTDGGQAVVAGQVKGRGTSDGA